MNNTVKTLITIIASMISSMQYMKSMESPFNASMIDAKLYCELLDSYAHQNIDICPLPITSYSERQIVDSLLNLYTDDYNGDFAELLRMAHDNLIEYGKTYYYRTYAVQGHNDIIFTSFVTPKDAFGYFTIKNPEESWHTFPIKVPFDELYISDNGHIAGIRRSEKEMYSEIEFFKINNINTNQIKTISHLGSVDSSSRIDGFPNGYRWYIDYSWIGQARFWAGNKFLAKAFRYDFEPVCISFDMPEATDTSYVYQSIDIDSIQLSLPGQKQYEQNLHIMPTMESKPMIIIDSLTFYNLKEKTRNGDINIRTISMPPDLSQQLVHTILDIDDKAYQGHWADSYREAKEYLKAYGDKSAMTDETFFCRTFAMVGHSDVLITSGATPVESYCFLSFEKEGGGWYTSPVRIPFGNFFISEQGYIVGIKEAGDARYSEIEFFKVDNFGTNKGKTIVDIGTLDSHYIPTGLSEDSKWYIPYSSDNDCYWIGDKFFIKGRSYRSYDLNDYSAKDIYICFNLSYL